MVMCIPEEQAQDNFVNCSFGCYCRYFIFLAFVFATDSATSIIHSQQFFQYLLCNLNFLRNLRQCKTKKINKRKPQKWQIKL